MIETWDFVATWKSYQILKNLGTFYVIRKLSEMRFKASWIPLVVYNPLFANELSTINLLITNLTFNDVNNGNCAKFIHS